MEAAETKSARLLQLEQILLAHPQGLHRAEIARRLGVHRSTVGRYIEELSRNVPIWEDGNLLGINRDDYLTDIRLTVHESMAVHLATRLMATRMDKHNPHAAAALRKLGQALEKFSPQISRHLLASANVIDDAGQRYDPNYLHVLETLTRAWSEGCMVHLWHKYEATGQVYEYDFAPYFIEPYAVGQTVHVIGRRYPPDEVRTFKVERIQRADLLRDRPYTIPETFDPQKMLADAWGIWYTEAEPVEVILKFHPHVAGRVEETRWHRSETTEPQPDGYLLWRARIAEPQEMLPWIRGWGADCEVLAPEGLREEVKDHVWKQAHTYAMTIQAQDINARLLRLWGKTTRDPERFHPALYHMFDVAHVAQQLLSPRASSRWRQVLADALDADAAILPEWLPFLVALHDIGKVSVPFQVLNTEQHKRLQAEQFPMGKATQADGRKLHHSIVGRLVLEDLTAGWPENLAAAFQEMVSGHHGIFQRDTRQHRSDYKWLQESGDWRQLRQQAQRILESYLLQQWPMPLPNPHNLSAAIVALNGFCILCDWLGSDGQYFPPAPHMPLAEYVVKSRQQAYLRVYDAGFFQAASSTAPTRFKSLFGFDPRPLQAAIDDIADDLLRQPTLTIIEAPTGEGKTEAALALARRIGALRGSDEMYVALPTTATSNAMFKRIQTYLQQHLHLPPEIVKLVHGQDFLVEDDLRVEPMESIEPDQQEPPSLAWFAPKKKALLAPFGVGTVDQAELAALNVRHNSLRMIGLAGKTVILDEVHAYDTYMTTIIKRMLTWLSTLGSSVILLSATLPAARRQELIQAFAGQGVDAAVESEAYPNVLTIGGSAFYLSVPRPFQPGKTIFLHLEQFADEEADRKADWLLEQVQEGGCVCWTANIVKRTQRIYAALLRKAPAEVELDLLHAAFPLAERQAREQAIFDKYGPTGRRPWKGIVVGTQVLEQSLDLDFDVMMTDLAPVDLVLQRAGRLHRHERDRAVRYNHQEAHLYMNTAIGPGDRRIYPDYLLQKTLKLLGEWGDILSLPENYRSLIEAVYTAPPPDDPLYDAWKDLEEWRIDLEEEADLRLMNEPDPDYPFYRGLKFQGFKEDEEGSGWMIAHTRWGQESITVIPLVRHGEMAQTVSGEVSALLHQPADRKTQLDFLRHSLRISHPALVKQLKGPLKPYQLFAGSALLRNYAPLWLKPGPDEGVFVGDDLPVPVRLHPKLGLVIGELED